MKAFEFLVLYIISTAAFSVVSAIYGDYTKLCSLFSKNTKIRLPGSCNQYIECNGETGVIINCPENTKYDKETGKCVKNLDTTKYCENRCIDIKKNGTFVAKPTFCRGYYYCLNGVAIESTCAQNWHFVEDEEKSRCVYPKDSNCIMDMVNNICEHVKGGTKFRNDADCSLYNECKNDKQLNKDCKTKTNVLYFNVESGKCEDRANVPCNAHTIPTDVCWDKKKKIPIEGPVSDGFSCRGYFNCAYKGEFAHDLLPQWGQCSKGQYFDPSTKKCGDPLNIKCSYDRCDGYEDRLATSQRNNCRNFLACNNNRNVSEIACKNDQFFDERRQQCVSDIIYYEICDQKDTHL